MPPEQPQAAPANPNTVVFDIEGDPVAKGRPRFSSRGSKVVAFTPKKTRAAENEISTLAALAMRGRDILDGPLFLSLFVKIRPPKSWSKTKRLDAAKGNIAPTSRPDLDNYLKLVADACNEIVYKDDSQICAVYVMKRYSFAPGIKVHVEKIHGLIGKLEIIGYQD